MHREFSYCEEMAGHSSSSSSSTKKESNMERLLHSLTPRVRLIPIPQCCIPGFNMICNPTRKPVTSYFTLRDLWLSYEEWSAYGAKTRVTIDNRGDVDHFFVPSLSAIQIFTNLPYENIRNRGKITSSKNVCSNHEDFFPKTDFFPKPYFEFHEKESPYKRAPLFDTIKRLSESIPGLQTLTSIDLTPASWMCVAWYPNCQIPNIGIPIKDFNAAFLTFHSLSSFYQDAAEEDNKSSNVRNGCNIRNQPTSLPPFGCAMYRFQGDIWLNHGHSDYEKLFDLYSAADSWIKQLGFEHHDFNFFARQIGHRAA